eukprot:5258346-Amphidinium_carterae.2
MFSDMFLKSTLRFAKRTLLQLFRNLTPPIGSGVDWMRFLTTLRSLNFGLRSFQAHRAPLHQLATTPAHATLTRPQTCQRSLFLRSFARCNDLGCHCCTCTDNSQEPTQLITRLQRLDDRQQ